MLVTIKQLEANMTEMLTLIKTYVDSRIRVYLARDASNVYAEAEVISDK